MSADAIFRYPVRSADVWGLNDGGNRSDDDIAADLDFQDNAVEDYLSSTIPQLYIQQSSIGSGIIDPTQLATGTPGAGKAPVGNPPVWTDVAVQTELDAHTGASTSVHGISDTSKLAVLGTNLDRGSTSFSMNGTTTTRSVAFSAAFSAIPVVTVTPLVRSDSAAMYANLTACSTGGFTVRLSAAASTSTTATVFWSAVTS